MAEAFTAVTTACHMPGIRLAFASCPILRLFPVLLLGIKNQSNQADGWTCSCGTVNKGKFCSNCGAKKPAGALLYKCDKCGWEPEDPAHPPKFCPECGDQFDEGDMVR